MNAKVTNIPGLNIPEHDHIDLSDRVGSTNNFATITYRKGGAAGTIVAQLAFTYIGGVPATDDAEIASVESLPV